MLTIRKINTKTPKILGVAAALSMLVVLVVPPKGAFPNFALQKPRCSRAMNLAVRVPPRQLVGSGC